MTAGTPETPSIHRHVPGTCLTIQIAQYFRIKAEKMVKEQKSTSAQNHA